VLAARLQADAATRSFSVLNHGIGGNRILLDGLGPNALARFDHDVLAQTGASYLIVLEGVNDIGVLAREAEVPQAVHDALVHQIESAYEQMVVRAHTRGIKVFGATILPFVGSGFYHPAQATEADRQAVNQWIRTTGHFDAVIDFDAVARDPEHPERLRADYDSGDHLHPSVAGYAAMAAAVPASLFVPLAAAETGPQLAITFDDLPVHGPLPAGETRLSIANKILAALREASLPPVYGFVNGQRAEQEAGSEAFFQAWRAAGQPLGNHTWSHMRLNDHSLDEYQVEVARDEVPLRKWMHGQDWHWFRYPYLSEGDTTEKKAGARAILAKQGYKVAAVTMNFDDYLWNEPYARCEAKQDAKSIAALEESYLRAADAAISYSRALSNQAYGRDIPYVLLMHVGAFDARMLPRLLALYRAAGFRFVTLQQAEQDAAYRIDTNLRLPPGPDTLEREMAARNLPRAPGISYAAQLDAMCR
jgi:peptidoglycan/xylan/chitin deacetylase (PgdA/CDA1 family)